MMARYFEGGEELTANLFKKTGKLFLTTESITLLVDKISTLFLQQYLPQLLNKWLQLAKKRWRPLQQSECYEFWFLIISAVSIAFLKNFTFCTLEVNMFCTLGKSHCYILPVSAKSSEFFEYFSQNPRRRTIFTQSGQKGRVGGEINISDWGLTEFDWRKFCKKIGKYSKVSLDSRDWNTRGFLLRN